MDRRTSRVIVASVGVLVLGGGVAATTSAAPPTVPQSPPADAAPEGATSGQPGPGPENGPSGHGEPGPGVAGRCGDTFSVDIDGAEAFWEIECSNPPQIERVKGWVEDTRLDGQAASLKFTDGGAILLEHFQARGWGESTTFEFFPQASETEVDGRLQLSW